MNDLISRQAAINTIEEYADRLQMVDWKKNPGVPYKAYALNWCINTIRDLPSAQPETTERTTETAQNVSDRDLISRKAAIDAIRASTSKYTGFMEMEMYTDDDAVEAIEALPPAQPERKRGRWRHYEGFLTCSECRTEYDDDIMTHCCDDVPKFCPNCGADMSKE